MNAEIQSKCLLGQRPGTRSRVLSVWSVFLIFCFAAGVNVATSPAYAQTTTTVVKGKFSKCKKHKKHNKHTCKKHRPHPQAFTHGLPHTRTVKVPLGGRGGGADPGNDYPAVWRNAPQDSMLDNWREYNRECTSFVAWALSSRNGFNMPFYDNANQWGPRAKARGFAVNSTPAPGSVAWSNAGTYGHVAYVQDVTGGRIHIEEYNLAGTGQYSSRVVSPSAFTGFIHFKDRAVQAPPPPPSTPQTGPIDTLGFVKVKNTSGPVEVHWDNLQGGSYKRAGSSQTDFSPADAGNGTWQLFGSANGAPQLGFIKTKNTGGTIEVHWDNLQGGTYRRVGDYVSDFGIADGSNGTWSLYGSGNPILGFAKLVNTGSGHVEGHSSALQGSAYKRIADYVSDFSSGDAGNGGWRIGLP